MQTSSAMQPPQERASSWAYLLDLAIYLAALYFSRQIRIPWLGYMGSVVFGSLIALAVAGWRMRARGVTWRDLGLGKFGNPARLLGIAAATTIAIVASVIAFEILKDALALDLAPDTSADGSRFGFLRDNALLLLVVLPVVWLESGLEELLDRGFTLTWLEGLFSLRGVRTVLAILIQAALFGFRHSFDISERSLLVALIGLVLGIAYVASGRQLWPVILAHCAMNSLSMFERVL